MTAVEDVSHIIVCVTGVSGFLGEHIVKCLLEKGYTVRGTVRDPTKEGPLQVSREQGGWSRLVLEVGLYALRLRLFDYDFGGLEVQGQPCATIQAA